MRLYGNSSLEGELLRNFRDSVLMKTVEGKELVRLYYQWSPVIGNVIETNENLRNEIKELLDEIVCLIQHSIDKK